MSEEEIKILMDDKPRLFKPDYFVVMEYLFNKKNTKNKILKNRGKL